jgi:hypothetical protein
LSSVIGGFRARAHSRAVSPRSRYGSPLPIRLCRR